MGFATFKGGIHPHEGKELSQHKPVQLLLPKGEMVFPMSQHIGKPAKPIVAVGDTVLTGQKLGEADGFLSACVISSVSGRVKAIEPRLVAGGSAVLSVIVENDGRYETVESFGTDRDPKSLSKEEIRSIIKEAGVVGLGGAGFPSHVKLTPGTDAAIDTIIVNGAECEPYLTSDYRMMLEEPEAILGGIHIILQLFDNAKGVIAIESNKPEAIKLFTKLVEHEPRISVCPLKTKYPQGGERSLIYAVTGRKINSAMLPFDAGCMVDNVDTVISIYNAVAKTTPLIRRIITVTGEAISRPQNYSVRTGTCYEELIQASGGFLTEPRKVISGGPMMGQALFDLKIPVTKVSSALTCLSGDEAAEYETTACIRCGRCARVCPSRVIPQKMMEAALVPDLKRFTALSGMECCECGCCAYVCPARIPLTQAFKEMRAGVINSRKKAQEVNRG